MLRTWISGDLHQVHVTYLTQLSEVHFPGMLWGSPDPGQTKQGVWQSGKITERAAPLKVRWFWEGHQMHTCSKYKPSWNAHTRALSNCFNSVHSSFTIDGKTKWNQTEISQRKSVSCPSELSLASYGQLAIKSCLPFTNKESNPHEYLANSDHL